MRIKNLNITIIILIIILFYGCATFTTKKVDDLNEKPNGVRIYPPRVYLFVDKDEKSSRLVTLPDYTRAYDVKPLTILAKQDFKVEIENGQLTSLASNQDTTAILTFIAGAAALAAKAAGVAVAEVQLQGTFGLDTGIYVLQDDGITFTKLQ